MSSVELARGTDAPGLIEALAGHGLRGEIVGEAHLTVRVGDCDEQQLAHALEDWIHDRHLPLVPFRLDDCTYRVSPPAG